MLIYLTPTLCRTDFNEKMARGGGAGVTRSRSFFAKLDSYCKERCSAASETYERACAANHILL